MLCGTFTGSLSSFKSIIRFFLSLSVTWQPYYSTRVNAADIDSRVKLLETPNKPDAEGEKSKAGFWEEFDVRFDLTTQNCFDTTSHSLKCQEFHCFPFYPRPSLF